MRRASLVAFVSWRNDPTNNNNNNEERKRRKQTTTTTTTMTTETKTRTKTRINQHPTLKKQAKNVFVNTFCISQNSFLIKLSPKSSYFLNSLSYFCKGPTALRGPTALWASLVGVFVFLDIDFEALHWHLRFAFTFTRAGPGSSGTPHPINLRPVGSK